MAASSNTPKEMTISKSEFLIYLDAPLHLWAEIHGETKREFGTYERYLAEQGTRVGVLGQAYLKWYLGETYGNASVTFEERLGNARFEARIDGLVYDEEAGEYDLYEIKSSTSVKKEHLYDVTFQRLAAEGSIPVRNVYLVIMNGEYIRQGEVDVHKLFVTVNVDDKVEELREEVLLQREQAWEAAQKANPGRLEGCEKPKTCPCVALCHGELPKYSIYDLPRLSVPKKRELKSMGILQIVDIPIDYALSEKQMLHMRAVKDGHAIIDHAAIRTALDGLGYPLYFLDYETYNPAVPEIDGYRPYEQIVFQYSLHLLPEQSGMIEHFEHLETGAEDASLRVVQRLKKDIGNEGSIVVWNQSFEATRNKEMAKRYPEEAEFLLGLNERMFDLMRIFSDGLYVDADFHGSASIKAVLPVLVGESSYEELLIGKGDEAMMAWVEIRRGMVVEEQIENVRKELLRYCELDTLAMVKNLEVLQTMLEEG